MMIPKIKTHASSVVAPNKKDRARVLGRGTRSKSKRHSPSASLLGSSTNVPTTRLERRSRTAPSNRTQGYIAHFRKNYHRLLLGIWNVLTLTEKRVGIGRRGEEISSRYCWSFLYQETWFWNSRFGWRVEAFLFRC